MEIKIKKNSKKFFFFIFCSISAILGGIITIALSPNNLFLQGLYLMLAGTGLLLFTLSNSTYNKQSFQRLSIYSSIIYTIALFIGSYVSLESGHILTAKIVGTCGILVIVFALLLYWSRKQNA